jgi:hypothetical protein
VKSRLGTSWVVGTPISKGVFHRIDLGILDGGPIGLGRPGEAPEVVAGALSTTNVLDSRAG